MKSPSSLTKPKKPIIQQSGNHRDFKKLLDSSLDVICAFDTEGKFIYASAAALRLWGYAPKELLGVPYMDLVYPDDHQITIAAADAITSGRDLTSFENRYIKKDGTLIPIMWSATWDKEEEVMYCIAKDISEKKQLEESLHQSRKLFEAFMDFSPLVGWITDDKGVMKYMNRLFMDTYGFAESDFGKSIFDLFTHEIATDYHSNNLRVLNEGGAIETIEKAFLPDGSQQVLKIFKFPLHIDGLQMVAGWAVDITEHMALQQALEQSIKRYQYVHKATSDAIFEWDLETNEVLRGEGFQKISSIHFENHPLHVHVHPDERKSVKNTVDKAIRDKNTDRFQLEYRFSDGLGGYRHLFLRAFIIRSGSKAIKVIGAVQDITEQKALQEKVNQFKIKKEVIRSIVNAQEKERKKLSNELHDNVNQMLASTKLILEYVINNEDADPELLPRCYDCLEDTISEIRAICHDLSPSIIDDIGIVEAIEEIAEKINLTGKMAVQLQHDVSSEFILEDQDKIALYRIVQEQVNNIVKHADAKLVHIDLTIKNGQVWLSIKDDGKGFAVETVKKGLGLNNILSRVEYYHGQCEITSGPGKGCLLQVTFKLDQKAREE
jgi:PAS domain S-box-containing protein